MDASHIISGSQIIVYAVNAQFDIVYASPQCYTLTSKASENSIGKKCYSEFIGRSSPCSNCPINSRENSANIVHDVITKSGKRLFLEAKIHKDDNLYIENLHDITELKKDSDAYKYEIKKMRSMQVASALKSREIQTSYEFLTNIMNNLVYGLMVVDVDHRIMLMNSPMKAQTGYKSTDKIFCYNIYNRDEPCLDCPLLDDKVKKSVRMLSDRNVTVQFEKYHNYVVESVRDTTRELQLIKEISIFQEEIQEKQAQMELLNKDLININEKLKAAQKVINEELEQVGKLQQSLLPESLPMLPGYEFASFYTPAEHAGGDYYDCIQMSNNHWGFTIADVSGHGAPAAVIMAMVRAIMRSYTYDVISSSEALYMVNEILCDNVHTRDFVTMFYMVLNTKTAEFNFASAGHNPVLFYDHSEKKVHSLTANGIFLATFPDMTFEEKKMKLDSGDIIFMYTDGLVEAMDKNRNQYGLDRVINKIVKHSYDSCEIIVKELMKDVKIFTDNMPFEDDVTIFVVKKENT